MNEPKLKKPDPHSLSLFVQRICRQKGLSIRDIQERAGGKKLIAASYISRIINGKVTNLSVDKLTVLAEGLGVDPFELFAAASGKRSGNATSAPDALELLDTLQQAIAQPDAIEVVQRWLRLSAEYQAAVMSWIRFLSHEAKANKQKANKPRRKRS
jgi:transcriptional regulator with XRE-family HTH domain